MISLEQAPSETVRALELPRPSSCYLSPSDWRDEIIYFLLPGRFSDGLEDSRPLLDPNNRMAARPATFSWEKWAQSGERYQGGTIRGITGKLEYIRDLGATTLWVSPIFKQRARVDSYHGYAIQNFLEVEPRLGTPYDLVDRSRRRTILGSGFCWTSYSTTPETTGWIPADRTTLRICPGRIFTKKGSGEV